MKGYHGNIERLVEENTNFRQIVYTAKHSQLVLMHLALSEEIGMEVHDVDQFFRFESGEGKVIIDDNEYTVSAGEVIIVPAGAKHNIINTSASAPLKLYTLYCPPHHKDSEHFDGVTTE